MPLSKLSCAIGVLFSAFIWTVSASAQDKNVKIGVMTDMTGPYSAIGGPGSAVAVNMAVENLGLA